MSGIKSPPGMVAGARGAAEPRKNQAQTPVGAVRSSQHITVAQVRALIAASECASFNSAASMLQMSPSAFSRCIKELECALGCELFIRTAHGTELTGAGAAFLPHAKSMAQAYDDMLSFVGSRRMGRRKTLRLAAGPSMGPVVLAALQKNLQENWQGWGLQLFAMSSEEVLASVSSQQVEFGLCGDMPGQHDVRYTPVLEAQLGLIAPTGCKLPASIQSLEDLNAVPLVRLADGSPVTRLLLREGVQFPAYSASSVVFSSLSSAFELMSRQNFAIVGTGIGASLMSAQSFRFIPLPELLPKLVVHLISGLRLSHDEDLELMRDMIRQSVHDSPWHPSVRRLNQLAG
jgi:DNA-binding transcriptional LysR family regulator